MRNSSLFIFILALIVSVFPPILLHILLKAEGPLFLVLFYLIILHLLGFFYYLRKPGSQVLLALLILALIFGAAVLLIQILINPYSAYVIWFQLIEEGKPRGSISFVFVSFTAYFLLLSTVGMVKRGVIKSLFASALVLLLTWFLIMQKTFVLGIFLVFLCVYTIFTISQRFKNTYRSAWGILYVIVFISIVGTISLGISSVVEPGGSRIIDSSLSPALRKVVVGLFPRFPLLYGIPGYGSRISEKNLSSTPTLTERPVFKVLGFLEEDLYLRTLVYKNFNGRGWANKGEEESEEGAGEELEENPEKGPSIEIVTDPEQLSSKDRQIQVDFLTEYYSILPHTLATEMVYSEGPISISRGDRNTGYILEKPLFQGQKIVLGEGRRNGSKEVEEGISAYLKIPKDLSEDIKVLAEKLKRSSKRETVSAIGSFLASGEFQYTLNPKKRTKKEKDARPFLDSFLFHKKEGFCTHFATAFIVLARYNEIPARYATGFYVNARGRDEPFETRPSTVVTGYSAHAWPEVNIPGIGWVVYEATPPMRPENYNDPDFWNFFFSNTKNYTRRQIEAILGKEAPKEKNSGVKKSPFRSVIVVVVLLVLFIIGVLIIHLGRVSRKGIKDKDFLKFRRMGRKIVKEAHKKGVPPPDGSGWVDWEDRIQERVYSKISKAEMPVELSVFRRAFFGGYTPTEKELRKLKELKKNIRNV